MTRRPRKALIIGAGIAGPVTAMFLTRAGIEAELYEAWPYSTGIGGGLQAAWDWLVGKLTGLVDLLPDTVKKVLGIASPSKVMMQLGKHTVSGFGIGMVNAANDVVPSAAGAMADAAIGGPGAAGAAGGSSSSSSVGNRLGMMRNTAP